MVNKIFFIHMLNNNSGSPNVLSVIIKGLVQRGVSVEIITSKSNGFLSGIDGVKYRYTSYKWSDSKIRTLYWFIYAHIELFFMVLFAPRKNALYYLNTILPFSAALACKLSGKKVVFHCHENMQQKKTFYGLYRKIYRLVNQKTVFVSKYVQSKAVDCKDGRVIYNGLSDDFYKLALRSSSEYKLKNILMVCSLRRYKGVYEFVEVARRMPNENFVLVVSDSEKAVNEFISEISPTNNLIIYPKQTNLHPFYSNAKVLLSLSHPDAWVETFGLTILEGMIYGIPAVVPNVGGPLEVVDNEVNGYTVNPKDIDSVIEAINKITLSEDVYGLFSKKALQKSKQFSNQKMINGVENYISK